MSNYAQKRAEEFPKVCKHPTKMVTPEKGKKTGKYANPPSLEQIDEHGDDGSIQEYGDEKPTEPPLRIQVSAKHLTVASPVFKRMLTGPWKESATYLQKGSVEITAESWDLEAFLILLRVMHCQFNQVPRKLTLEMLAKLAVVVDYYECREVVRFFSDTWIETLDEKIIKTYSRNLILWIWVALYFQLTDQFGMATMIAMSYSNGGINNLGLPIPDRVIDLLNDGREIHQQGYFTAS